MQLHRRLLWIAISVATLVLAASGSAHAACAGKQRVTGLTPIYIYYTWFYPGHQYNIKTVALSTGSDTVLHVQDATTKGYIAGNDDCIAPGRDSCVAILNPPTTQNAVILVRAYDDVTSGTASLQIWDNGVLQTQNGPFAFGGKTVETNPGVSGNVNYFSAYTAQIWKQVTDTILILEGPYSWQAATFDDDSGWRNMSSLLFSGVTKNTLVVGTYPGQATGDTTLIWDTDDLDIDVDGVGDCLETLLKTSSSTLDLDGDGVWDGQDTDGDGLGDMIEISGEVATHGADPLKPDVFVEADWYICNGCADPDEWRLSADTATKVVKFYQSPNGSAESIAMHIDTGRENTVGESDPSFHQWGNWGGANRRTDSTIDCSSLSTDRKGQFLLDVITCSLGCGARYTMGWDCATGDSPGAVAHEMGHLLGLDHGPTGGANFQATYESVMNYAHQERITVDDPTFNQFSPNKYKNILFNPYTGIDEQNWKGSNTADIKYLFRSPFSYYNGGSATQTKVDWNQDRVIQTAGTKVKGRANWPSDNGNFRTNPFVNESNPALVWFESPAGNRLYFFSNAPNGTWQMRYSTDVESACKVERSMTDVNQDLTNPCGTWSSYYSTGRTGYGPTSVVQFTQGGTKKLMIVDKDSSVGELKYTVMTVSSSGTVTLGTRTSVPGSKGSIGLPGAVFNSATGVVDIYAPMSGELRRWTYKTSTSQWTRQGNKQNWIVGTSTTPITGVAEGIGAAWGLLRGSSTSQLLAVVPYGSSANADVGRKDSPANENWIKYGSTGFKTDARPGLVYIPNTSQSDGRLMAIFRNIDNKAAYGAISEGNDTATSATSRRITTWYVAHTGGGDPMSPGGFVLSYNSTYDTNARGARARENGSQIDFLPIADGLINHTFRDQNDYPMLKKNNACAISQGARCWHCNSLTSGGLCANWTRR